MTLRTRTVIALGVTLLLLAGTAWAVAWVALWDGFDALERTSLDYDLARVKRNIGREVDALDQTTHDNASWNAAYAYLRGENPDFLVTNTSPEALDHLDLNVLITVAIDGSLRYSAFKSAAAWGDLPPELYADFRPVIEQLLANASARGLIQTRVGLAMFAARPVLPSNEDGPSAGVVIMARIVTPARVAALNHLTDIDAAVQPLAQQALPADFAPAQTALNAAPQSTYVTTINANTVHAFGLVNDYRDQPVAILKIARPRPVHQQGRRSMALLTAGLATVCAGFLIVTLLGLDRLVLRRLASVNKAVSHIADSTDFRARIPVDRADELGQLSAVINEMLKSLDAQRRLEQSLTAAQNADHAKSLFLAKMSHELRTPLNAIMGYGQLLHERLSEQHDVDGAQDVTAILMAAERLTNIISDILDFARIESGRMGLARESFVLRECIQSAVATIERDIRRKHLRFTLSIDPETPETIHGDTARLRQVLVHLLHNAVRFTDQGEIALTVNAQLPLQSTTMAAGARPRKHVELLFQIRDTGMGIAPEIGATLFAPFQQADNSMARRYEGAGLGLALCKQLCAMMGGTIWFSSAPGQGSTFCFTICDAGKADA